MPMKMLGRCAGIGCDDCLPPDCTPCVGSPPMNWEVTFQGVAGDVIYNCGGANRTFILSYVTLCNWQYTASAPLVSDIDAPQTITLAYTFIRGFDITVSRGPGALATYTILDNLPTDIACAGFDRTYTKPSIYFVGTGQVSRNCRFQNGGYVRIRAL